MRILFFDTALARLTVGLAEGERVLASLSEDRARGHADRLVPAVGEVMAEAGASFGGLDAVGCTVGPGTFTGIRAGVAAARAFGLAAGIRQAGVTTLRALAASAPGAGAVTAAIDARRGEVYLQNFRAGAAPDGGPLRLALEEAGACVPGGEPVLVGSGARLVRDAAGRGRVSEGIEAPSAGALARCLAEAAGAEELLPLYLRPPDATPPGGWRRPPPRRPGDAS